MLYNSNWDENKDIHSLDNLIGWLKSQDPARGYFYLSNRNCLLAQYYTAQGLDNVHMGQSFFTSYGDYHDLPDGFNKIAHGSILTNTIGYALNRALKYKKSLETNGEYAYAV